VLLAIDLAEDHMTRAAIGLGIVVVAALVSRILVRLLRPASPLAAPRASVRSSPASPAGP
jgi:cytochrome b561